MERTDQGVGAGSTSENRIEIQGDAGGAVIAGNCNVVVDARQGAVVNLVTPGERPNPVRRGNVRLLPRAQREPLGRSAELASVAAAAHADGLIQLWGPAGIGKSALLRHAARTLPPGPDGVLYLSAAHRDIGDLAQEIFEGCYDCVGYAPSAPELRRLMAGVRVRVYVDNAELTEEQLRELADAVPDATFIFAGRNRSLLGDGTAVEVRGIDRAAGIELLARTAGSSVWDNMTAAGELWQAADGRPLLLLRAAALIRLDASGAAVFPRPRDVEGVIPLLLERLDARTSGVLRLLAVLGDAKVAPVHIGALAGESDPVELCGRLVELGLAEGSERGFRCAPDVVARLRRRDALAFPVDRLCAHVVNWLTDPATTPAEVADHARALEVVAEHAENAGEPAAAVEILRAASPMMARSLRFGVWGRLLGRGWTAARNAGDPRAMAYFTHEEGVRSLVTGRRVIATVLLPEAAVLWRESGTDGAGGGGSPFDGGGPGADHDGLDAGFEAGPEAGTPAEQVTTHMTELAAAASFPGTGLPPLTPTAPVGPGPSACDPTASASAVPGPADPGPTMSGTAAGGTAAGAAGDTESPAAAEPTQTNTASGHGTVYTVMEGDMHIHHEAPAPASSPPPPPADDAR